MTGTLKATKIDEELVSVDSLVHYLKQVCGHQEILVNREKNDPPDFWLQIDGMTFAVEVTSIVNDQGYLARCNELEQSVQKRVKQTSDLNGTYALIIQRNPKLPIKTSSDWQGLVDKIFSFISKTKEALSTDICYIQKDSYGLLGIKKISDKENAIGCCIITDFKWEGNVQKELAAMIQNAILTKRSKLEKKNVHQQCPDIILVFYDAYGFCNTKGARNALQNVKDYDWFHSIFWAESFTDKTNLN